MDWSQYGGKKKSLTSSYVGEIKYLGRSAIKIAGRLYHMLFNNHVTARLKMDMCAEWKGEENKPYKTTTPHKYKRRGNEHDSHTESNTFESRPTWIAWLFSVPQRNGRFLGYLRALLQLH
jgi:hypothetical protein